jgi:protein disulfide-isomerase A6
MFFFGVVVVVVGLLGGVVAGVVDLDETNFDSVVNGDKHVLVEFFAPWCGHCKNLAPIYEEVGVLFEKTSDVVIAKVDADKHKSLGSRFGVSGFPTLKWFPKGSKTAEDFGGGREAESIISWINNKVGTNVRVVKPASAVKSLDDSTFDGFVKDSKKDVLVEFFAPWCGHCKALAPKYEKLAKVYADEATVGIASVDCDANADLCQNYGVTGYPTIKFFPKNNKAGESYEGGRELDDFVTFINDKAGTQRLASGGLNEQAGRISELDDLASGFNSNKEATLAKIDGVIASLQIADGDKPYASYYKTVMTQVIAKGESFISGEIARLEKMLASKSIAGSKVADFTKKVNILKQF